MRYFAYGSNMSIARIQKRCPNAKATENATLPGWRLGFSKPSTDGSAKANILQGVQNDARWFSPVYGVLFDIPDSEIENLNRAEGARPGTAAIAVGEPGQPGEHYSRTWVEVTKANSSQEKVVAYISQLPETDVLPTTEYANYLVVGAKENKLPEPLQTWLANHPKQ